MLYIDGFECYLAHENHKTDLWKMIDWRLWLLALDYSSAVVTQHLVHNIPQQMVWLTVRWVKESHSHLVC